jgi:hypothetical protein
MWAFLASALAAIPSAATSTFSLIAFALAIAAYVFIVWRVVRNKNLLQHLQKLSNYGGSPLGNTFLKQIRLIGRPAT